MFFNLVSFYLFYLTSAFAFKLQLSTDNGNTWQPFDTPVIKPPRIATIRLADHPSILLHLPSCALEGSLRIQVWTAKQSDKPIGFRWQSSVCHPHLTLPNGIVIEHLAPHRRKPDWLNYARQSKPEDSHAQSNTQQQKSFFAKYGLYIMILVGIALGQGIRKGLAEVREEMEREERAQKQKNIPGQVKVIVPKRKQSSKTRKRATPSSAK